MNGKELPEYFHLPYQFVPVDTKKTVAHDATEILHGTGPHPARHDVWVRQRYSGRILCQLRTDSPLVVGADQDKKKNSAAQGKDEDEEPATVMPYRRDNRIAIPGNSLRGMIGAVAEALSQSALRKLGKPAKPYSVHDSASKRRIETKGNLHDAFRRSGGDNALPWGETWQDRQGAVATRTQLTPAELLFGVAADEGNANQDDYLAALAGRVSFNDAVLPPGADARLMPAVTLQVLASPCRPPPSPSLPLSPPSPAFYFSQREPQAVSRKLLDLTRHSPNGRKVYVPHRKPGDKEPWRHNADGGKGDTMRLCVTPIEPATTFYFAVDFDHLHKGELHLLLSALQPDAGFLHRLGLGKPLGLGHVQIQIKAVCRFIRANRYRTEALDTARYEDIQTVPGFERDAAMQAWLDQPCFRSEHRALYLQKTAKPKLGATPAQNFEDPAQNLIDRHTLDIVRTVGNRSNLCEPTHYPRCKGTGDTEEKLYEWNVSNDKSGPREMQWLKPVKPGEKLPTLRRNERPQRGDKGGGRGRT